MPNPFILRSVSKAWSAEVGGAKRMLDPQRRYLSRVDWDLFVSFYREAGAR
jgi:hypothetical protein